MKKTYWLLAAAAVLFLVPAGLLAAATASDPQPLGTYGDWSAYSFTDSSGKVCFMNSQPQKQEASVKGVRRDPAFFFITHWAGEGARNVISVSIGYPFQENSTADVQVDGKTFKLFTQNERAWARDSATDNDIADAVQKGSTLVVKGTSRRGTVTTDTYSLRGSGDAYKAISQACGL